MKLTGADRFNAEKTGDLEKYVDEQVASSTFDLEANLALLRMYQFSPQTAKIPVLAKILLKALMQLPQSEYKACIHVVPERLQLDETIAAVINLAHCLETCRFADFWQFASQQRDLLNSVPGFYDAVRNFIVHVTSLTFQRTTKQQLSDSLMMTGTTLDALIAEKVAKAGWSVQKPGAVEIILLPKTEYNQLVVKRTQDIITFDQVAPLLKTVTSHS